MNRRIARKRDHFSVMNKGYSESGASYTKKSLKAMIPNSGAPNEDIDDNNMVWYKKS